MAQHENSFTGELLHFKCIVWKCFINYVILNYTRLNYLSLIYTQFLTWLSTTIFSTWLLIIIICIYTTEWLWLIIATNCRNFRLIQFNPMIYTVIMIAILEILQYWAEIFHTVFMQFLKSMYLLFTNLKHSLKINMTGFGKAPTYVQSQKYVIRLFKV